MSEQSPERDPADETLAPIAAGHDHGDASARVAGAHGYEVVLTPDEFVPGRPFTDPAETDDDAWIMGDMLRQQRAMARTWQREGVTGSTVSDLVEAGWRQMVAVPDPSALLTAVDVTAVGFFGHLRAGVDHTVLFEHERRVAETFEHYARLGLLSYYDLGPEHGRYGNLILFWTPDVPHEWHRSEAHNSAVADAPAHYSFIRLHKGRIPGPFLSGGALHLERTTYLDFQGEQAWRALRVYPLR